MVKRLKTFVAAKPNLIAAVLLLTMFGLGATSMAGDSGIVDEVAHIPAGYSYLKYQDYRLNPEHPPLIKDLAAAPLLFMNLQFPTTNAAWTTDVNGQWESGWHFIYHDGNNADRVLFFARLPILLLALVLGWVLYRFTKNRFGTAAGLLTLFFYVLCPNVMAHSRFVTTDLGAAAFIFFSFITFLKYLELPTKKNLGIATVFFALAQLAKFSAVLLVPFYFALLLVAVIVWSDRGTWQKRLLGYLLGFIGMGIGALALIWLFYIPHVLSMPSDVQDALIRGSLVSDIWKPVVSFLTAINGNVLTRALVQYLLGVAMVVGRVAGGNTTYFLGQVTNQSFVWYFPVTYLIKTPVALLILILATFLAGVWRYLRKTPLRVWRNFVEYTRSHHVEFLALGFIAFYSYISISGNLNLGIRHLLPIFPFIFLLVGVKTVALVRSIGVTKVWPIVMVALLMVYYAGANVLAYPSYLSYMNELVGGTPNADKYLSDSSVDWGQDLKRLHDYVATRPEIKEIAVDYFGGGEPKYYFCDRVHDAAGKLVTDGTLGYDCSHSVYKEWHAQLGVPKGYIAVSETFLTNDIYWAAQRGDSGYSALRAMKPIAKIGGSIYVYNVQ